MVIPKEIRRTMRIREGDPLEIYTDKDGGVIFKKYSLMGGLGDFAGQMCETLNKTTGEIAVITDRDACIAVGGRGPPGPEPGGGGAPPPHPKRNRPTPRHVRLFF